MISVNWCSFRRILTAMLVLLGVIAAIFGVPEAAGATDAPSQEYNMCQDRCHRNPGDADYRPQNPQDKVVWFANTTSPVPWYIGLTEACILPVAYIAFHVPTSMTTHFYAHQANAKTAPCDQNGYGAGSVEFGSTVAVAAVSLPFTSGGMDCVSKQGYGFQWLACVTHLLSSDDYKASIDLNYIYNWWLAHPGFLIFAGDLNLNRDNFSKIPVAIFDPSWDLDDNEYANTAIMNPTGDFILEEKIDWDFGRPSVFLGGSTGATDCDTNYSDHCYLYGRHRTS